MIMSGPSREMKSAGAARRRFAGGSGSGLTSTSSSLSRQTKGSPHVEWCRIHRVVPSGQ